jgi:uncharacterized protein YlxW (UPF0749 family)
MSYLHAAALLIAMLLGAAGGWGIKGVRADAAVNAATQRAVKVELALAAERAAWQAASRASTEEQRAEEQRRQAAKDKEVRDAQEQARLDAARAAASRRAADQLREHVARLATRADQACSGSDAAPGGPPAAGPGLVLADLYRGADDEAHELAQAFDLARRAGLVCERLYDSLSKP